MYSLVIDDLANFILETGAQNFGRDLMSAWPELYHIWEAHGANYDYPITKQKKLI